MSKQEYIQPDCDALRELIPAYSVGATDPEETLFVEQQLPLCPEVAAELDEYLALAQAMVFTAPMAQPPARLHDQLMAAVRAEPPARTAAPPKPISAPAVVPRPRVLPLNRLIAGVAAVAAALLIISNIYWVGQVNSLNQQQQDLTALLHDQQDALASLGTGRGERVELVSTEGTNDILATVAWSPQSDTAVLYTDDLPALAPDRAYQVWLIKDSQPISAGVFQLDERGFGSLVFQTDQPMGDYSAVAISTEPVEGSEQPTTPPVASAQI